MILSAADNGGSNMMMLLLVLCACTIMIVLLRRHQFRSSTQRDQGREQLARVRDQRRLHQSMDELLVQLEDASRRIGAQLDTKFAKLETAIRDADDRITRLRGVLQQPDDVQPHPPLTSAKGSRSVPAGASSTKSGGDAESQSRSDQEADEGSADPRFQRIYDLVDAGATPIRAAEELGMPLGEVELILNLRKLR